MKLKISKTWLVIIIVIVIVVGYFVIKGLLKNPVDSLLTEVVKKGTVLQEVFETGSVRATENISLGFKTIGKVSRVNVNVGDNVKKGDVLAELDASQSAAQLQSAKAALDSAINQYNKLINGLTPEDIKTYENAVASSKNDLQGEYNSALNILNNAYNDIYNAYNASVTLRNDYFGSADQQGIRVSDGIIDISVNLNNVKKYIDSALNTANVSNIDMAIEQTKIGLDNVYNSLEIIREQCDFGPYFSKVSAADKTSIDTYKANINTAANSVTTLKNSISSYKIALQKAQDNLNLKTASARPEDIDIYKAAVSQAQANVNALASQVGDNRLISPIDGKITEVDIKIGQVISSTQVAINMLSTTPFQLKVNIYEQDIVNVKVGDEVKINLVAFPKKTFAGKVLSIDPAETIIDNVVYYEVTIEFPDQPQGIRSGMTADITIETNKKDDVITVPRNAVAQIDDTMSIQVIKNRKIENVNITTGLEGNDFFEVTSGLSEGDVIVVGKK